jgi:cytoskeletal protein CcmA (bactofilin family)
MDHSPNNNEDNKDIYEVDDSQATSLEDDERDSSTYTLPDGNGSTNSSNNNDNQPPKQHLSLTQRFIKRVSSYNIYGLLFGVVVIIGLLIGVMSYLDSRHATTTANITAKGISASTLAQLANTSPTVGSTGQLLNVESSAIFAGQILARQDLDVAGNLSVGGTLALSALTVSGFSQFGQTSVNKDLAVAGNTDVQGNTTVTKNLQVGGSGTFSGNLSAPQITTSSLQLTGNLIITHHITTTGTVPTRTYGSALGSGGTASVSGSDTAGNVTINTGGSPAAGCFVTINFITPFSTAPYITVTPVGSSAGGLSYYINRTTNSFSICDTSTPPADVSFGFDYFSID